MAFQYIVLTDENNVIITTETGEMIIVGFVIIPDTTSICMEFETGQPGIRASARQPSIEAIDYSGTALGIFARQPSIEVSSGQPRMTFAAGVCD